MVGIWLRRHLFRMKAKSLPRNVAFAVPFTLYSINAKRAVQVRARRDGFAYFMPQVHVGDQRFEDQGSEIGPFDTPEDAERAAASGGWLKEEPPPAAIDQSSRFAPSARE